MKLPFFSSKQIDDENGLKFIDKSAYESTAALAKELAANGLTASVEPAYELGEPPVLTGGSDEDAANGDNAEEMFEEILVNDAAPAAMVVVAAANRR
jgi:hypothetical protein